MTRISIDPSELAVLSALCRNASYDVAGIATEARHRMEQLAVVLAPAMPAAAAQLSAVVDAAAAALHRVAAQLDDDALAVASFGQRGADADAVGGLHGNEDALLRRMTDTEGDRP